MLTYCILNLHELAAFLRLIENEDILLDLIHASKSIVDLFSFGVAKCL